MFGFGKATDNQPIRWSQLRALLEDDDQRAAIDRLYPEPGRESYLAALRRTERGLAEAVFVAGRQLERAAPLAEQPTIAIAGMLNSGKTSLVANFLSPQGRARSLRGLNNRQGTHRFVLWLPEAWQQDAELWGLLMQRIGDTLGQPPELLASEPEQAHRQYNNADGDESQLAVPLVATDPALDQAGLGLLDCPDIVSHASFGRGGPESRREMLGRASTLCSAFLVVTTPEQFRDATLADHLRIAADLMAGVPRYLAVNKVRPRQTPEQVWETFQPIAEQHGVDKIYAAYDFDIQDSRPFIPDSVLQADRVATAAGDPLPVFFSLRPDADINPPAAIPADRLLINLPGQLDRTQLFNRFRVALEASLRTAVWDRGYQHLQDAAAESNQHAQRAQRYLLETVLEFFAHRQPGGGIDELRMLQNEEIVKQLTTIFAAAAPWYARWGVRLNSYIVRITRGARELFDQIVPTTAARQQAEKVRRQLATGEVGGILTGERLAHALQQHGATAVLPGDPDEITIQQRCIEAIERFRREDLTRLDEQQLTASVREMWKEVSVKEKLRVGLTPLTVALAGFGAVLLIPVDFGGTAAVAAASIPELLAAAGLATLANYWSGRQATQSIGQQAARRQVSNFTAVLCDAFGIPRFLEKPEVVVKETALTLPKPQIPAGPPPRNAMLLWQLRDAFRSDLDQLLPRSQR